MPIVPGPGSVLGPFSSLAGAPGTRVPRTTPPNPPFHAWPPPLPRSPCARSSHELQDEMEGRGRLRFPSAADAPFFPSESPSLIGGCSPMR